MTNRRIEGRAATCARGAGGWSLAPGAVVASMLLIVVACGGGAAVSSGAPVAVASPSVAMNSIALTATPVASVAMTDALTSSPSPAPSVPQVPDPFTVVRSIPWAGTELAIPLGIDVGPDGLLYILDTKPSVTVIDPKDGRIVRTWGRQGTGPGEFDVTRPDDNPGTGDIAVAPNGQVYVADGSNHRVQVFRPDGTYISQFGSFGSGDGQFGSVDEIAIGRDGSIYLRDGTANRISAFTPDGKFRWRSPTPESDAAFASYMQGIAVRSGETLLVDCEQCRDFLVLDPRSGDLAGRVESPELHGNGGPLTIDPAGNIHVATFNSESNLVLDAKGTLVGGRYLSGTMHPMEAGKKVVWGDVFWPAPAFLPDGRGFTFWKDGLAELKVTLPLK